MLRAKPYLALALLGTAWASGCTGTYTEPAGSDDQSGTSGGVSGTAPGAGQSTEDSKQDRLTPAPAGAGDGGEAPRETPLTPAERQSATDPNSDDGSNPGDIDANSDVDSATVRDKVGAILIDQGELFIAQLGVFTAASIGANFGLDYTFAERECETTTLGSCTFIDCPGPNSDAGGNLSAGELSLSGFSRDLPLTRLDAGGYIGPYVSELLWTESQTVSVAGTGSADVPAFDVSLELPGLVQFDLPSTEELGTSGYVISRATDWELRWTGRGVGRIEALLASSTPAGTSKSLSCMANTANGTLTVPRSLMAKLDGNSQLLARALNIQDETVGEWSFQFIASTNDATAAVTFED